MQALEHPTHVFRTNNARGRYRVSEQSLLFLLKKPSQTATSVWGRVNPAQVVSAILFVYSKSELLCNRVHNRECSCINKVESLFTENNTTYT
jgi:hypothetical protein